MFIFVCLRMHVSGMGQLIVIIQL